MRYNAEIEATIIAQIQETPDKPIILPDWAYGMLNQPIVYRNSQPVRLARVLYEKLIGPLPESKGLRQGPGVHIRNINPYLFVVTASPRTPAECPNGHAYSKKDKTPNGYKCHICHESHLLGTPNPIQLNAKKKRCPKGHKYEEGNLVNLKNGRRRCKKCHAATQARLRARKKKEAS